MFDSLEEKIKNEEALSLKFRVPAYELLIISVVTVVPISIAGLYSLAQSDQSLHVTIGNNFSAIAASTAAGVSQFILERVTEVGRLAADPALVDAVTAANKSYAGMNDAVAATIEKREQAWNIVPVDPFVNQILASRVSVWLRSFPELDPRILRITVSDQKGATIAVTHKPAHYFQGDEEYWGKIYDEGKGAVSLTDIRYDEVTKADYIGVGWPVRDEGNHFIGAVNVLVDVTGISSIIGNRPPSSPGQRILLVKEDGTVIAAPQIRFSQRIKSPEYAALRDSKGPLAAQQAGYILASFSTGGQLIGFADTGLKKDYPNFDWVVLVCQDAKQSFGAVRLVGRMIALDSLIGLVMVTLLVAYFTIHRKEPITEIGELGHKPFASRSPQTGIFGAEGGAGHQKSL